MMGKRHSKKQKDTANGTESKDNANGDASSSSKNTTRQSSRDQVREMADKTNNSLPDVGNLCVRESEPRSGQTHSEVSGVITDHGQGGMSGHVERGVASTGNPVTADTVRQTESQAAVVHLIHVEQTSNASSSPLTNSEPSSLEGQPHSLTPTPTQEQRNPESEAITITPDRSDTRYTYPSGTVCAKIIANQNLKRKIALYLDRHHPVVKSWQHLASALGATIEVLTQCKINAEYSYTEKLFEYIAAKQPNLTMKEFVSKLREIGRNDVVVDICRTFENAENSTERFCIALNNITGMQLADDIAQKLDIKSRVNRNWENLAYKLGVPGRKVSLIKSGHSNPTAGIMEYVFAKHAALTLKEFKSIMNDIDRNDVLEHLKSHDETKKLVEVMPRDSELLEDVSICLNNNAGGSLKDWKNFACHLKIPQEVYNSYDPKKPHSPTEILLDWLVASKPDYTVAQLCSDLHSIDRNDVSELIKSTLEPNRH